MFVLKNWPNFGLAFDFIHVFSLQFNENNSGDWTLTTDLWSQKQPLPNLIFILFLWFITIVTDMIWASVLGKGLSQLCHNHCCYNFEGDTFCQQCFARFDP